MLLALQLVELGCGKRRLPQRFGDEPQEVRQMGAHGLAARRGLGFAAAERELRAELVERVLEGLPVALLSCPSPAWRRPGAARRHAFERRLVAVMQAQLDLHRCAARLLRQQRDAHAVRQREPLRAGFEIGRRRLERFAGGDAGIALVVLDHRRDVDGRRRRRAIGLGVGNELAQRAVRRLQVFERHPLHVGGGRACATGRAAGRRAASRPARSIRRSPRRASADR